MESVLGGERRVRKLTFQPYLESDGYLRRIVGSEVNEVLAFRV